MKIDFTKTELKAIEFAVISDLEIVTNMIEDGHAELRNIGEYANLNSALVKIRKELKEYETDHNE